MSYLISKGSINDFTVRPTVLTKLHQSSFQKQMGNNLYTKNIDGISPIIDEIESLPFESDTMVGEVFLKELTLRKNFEGTLANLFKPNTTINEVYFLVWSWDLSGNKFFTYPYKDTNVDEWIKPMKKNDTAKFMHGDGLPIFPKGEIKNGVGIHIEVWESDKDIRIAGEKILEVKETIDNSDLTKIITGLTTIAKPEIAQIGRAHV